MPESQNHLTATPEEGEPHRFPIEKADQDLSLTRFLQRHDLGLNTRCGERGLCAGCTVKTAGEGGEPFRACQVTVRDLTPAQRDLLIPVNSLMRHEPSAVSDFRINIPFGSAWPPDAVKSYGVAVDVGTTTVALLIANLATGEVLTRKTASNAQAGFGDNVMTRITQCVESETAATEMQEAVIDRTLLPMLHEALQETGVAVEQLAAATFSGNPTMLHLLRGISPASMSTYPFKPVFLETQELRSSDLRFPGDFPAILLPGLGAFVGADLSAGLLATGMLYEEGPVLLVDVGTNGEILLKHAGGITGCATAAGPAFEGGRLRSGMRAATGAVSHLRLDRAQPLPVIELIGDKPGIRARGVCGSAYIDFLAEGLRSGLLNEGGRFEEGTPWQILDPTDDEPGRVFPIDPKRAPDVVIAETDVAELLQAKAAICGGVLALLEEAEVAMNDIKQVYLAGGFGLHLNVRNALDMGLLPPFAEERVSVAGNASLAGSYLTMLDSRLLQDLRQAIADAEMLELNQIASFEDFYISSLRLGPPDLD